MFGMNVTVTFANGTKTTLYNVTEIHYNYPTVGNCGKKIAFESDIHSTGVTYHVCNIYEFESVLATEKHKGF